MRKDISPRRGIVTRVGTLALAAGLTMCATVSAQEQDQTPEETQEVVVTGYRAALRSALETKRESGVMVDAINSDDIADFPDANLAESLQRIPGISIDRDQGEGRTITVRGLGADFTRVRINGLEALATTGNNDSGTSPNRSRAFDFNTFASELFSSLKVQKTSSAETDEGSLGATVDLVTGRPFDFKDFQLGFSAEDSFYENGETHNPKLAGLVSWHNDTFGMLLSAAYSERTTAIDQYRRSAASSDYLYRQSNFDGAADVPQRSGFSAPTDVNLTTQIPNAAARAAMQGSDPTAYNNLYPGAPFNTPGRFDDSTVRIPTLASIEQSDVEYARLGVTNSYQWKPDDTTTVNLDLLYSNYDYSNIIYQVSTVGLNRNNTLAAYSAANPMTASTFAQRRAMFPTTMLCTYSNGLGTTPPQDCGQQIYGATPLAGFQVSLNPKNLDTYEYYNNPASVFFTSDPSRTADPLGLKYRDVLIGRPSVDVLESHVSNGVADYLKLRNVDLRSAADASFYTTTFRQASLNVEKEVTDDFHASFTYGQSASLNESDGQLVEFNAMDTQGPLVYDERAGGDMPILNFGIDAANPGNWGIVKGFSAMRHYKRLVENKYDGGRLDLSWKMNEQLNLLFGVSAREYSFKTQQRERNNDILNPTELEARVGSDRLGHVVQFGQGLDVPAGTLSSFWAPNLDAFAEVFGFRCDCVNQYGDFRAIRRNSGRDDFGVTENDRGLYAQLDFDFEVFGRRAFGNLGVREAFTDVVSNGNTNNGGGLPLVETNSYSDFLPAMNLAYEVVDDLLIRAGAAKVMARPQLSNLAPTITALTVPTNGEIATLTIGNPRLNPFRGTNYDISVEWYFNDEGALLSAAYFTKDVESFPQTIFFEAPLDELLSAESAAQIYAGMTPTQRLYVDLGLPFRARQFRDAPGGDLSGFEVSYQQDFTFLPGFLKNLGAQINYTHIDSKLNYILDPGDPTRNIPQRTGTGPWLGASPEAVNFTLYYEVPKFSARVSAAQRAEYFVSYPIAGGVCNPGIDGAIPTAQTVQPTYCNTPLINDFTGSEKTLNVDASVRWSVNDNLSVNLEALNLTNQTTNRFAYVDSPVVTQFGSTGRQFTLGARYKY